MDNTAAYKIELVQATEKDYPKIQNLARFYVYELSRYKSEEINSELSEDRLYEASESSFEFEKYWKEPNYFPFLIRVNDELAGFVLINNKGSSEKIDWFLAEFFIVAKFQKMGIGRIVALQIFEQFKGYFELTILPENVPALRFWRSLLKDYTKGHYVETREIISDPKPHEMIIQQFHTSTQSSAT